VVQIKVPVDGPLRPAFEIDAADMSEFAGEFFRHRSPGLNQVLADEAGAPGNQNASHPGLSGQLTTIMDKFKCLDLQRLLLI
jgi:hypothetical protein